MLRDLPKTVPSVVLSAAQAALDETDDLIQRQRDAKEAYHVLRRGSRTSEEAVRLMRMGLEDRAQALVDWGAMLQDGLPPALAKRFRVDPKKTPCVSVIRHELALAARPGFQGGTLRTELSLELDRGVGLFRHDDWFDGFRMTGGGLLNTPTSLFHALHPEMLVAIHELVAEGQNWRRVEVGLDRLVEAFKDR